MLFRNIDSKIRPSYFGRSSDFFYFHGENLKYYDVNSLYPYAMLLDMPVKYLATITGYSLKNLKLDDVFGFVEAIVTCPILFFLIIYLQFNIK